MKRKSFNQYGLCNRNANSRFNRYNSFYTNKASTYIKTFEKNKYSFNL